ncbi:MAG: hypothetical protein PHR73_01310 [Candidatus Omnitrophica bacterium]|nr:hypothetical protein [Candidatus Omnitrophota bacterium]
MQRKFVLVARLLLFVFCGMGVYLLISNLMLRESLKKISKAAAAIKDKDTQQYKKIEQGIRRDMEEKYRADMISYQVVNRRLEQEKNRQNDLAEKGGGR